MASIHALPVELLARIFHLGMLDAPPPSSISPLPRDPPFEVLASHVCPHWRAVALRMPSLWTHITLASVPHIARARTYLTRSVRHPVHILVDSASEAEAIPGHSIFRDEFPLAFDTLTPHIPRWRSLVLRVRDLQCKASARAVLSTCGPAPLLDTLDLWHLEDWGSPERLFNAIGPPPVVVFAGGLPALTRLSLIGVNIQWAAASSPFLRNLTDLELGVHSDDVRIPFDRWRDVLLASPGLVRLSLTYSGPRASAGPWRLRGAGPVPLLALAELKLVDLDAPYVCALLRTIHAPAVRCLHLELGDPEHNGEHTEYEASQDFTSLLDMLACPPPEHALADVIDPTVPFVYALDEDEMEDGQEEGARVDGHSAGRAPMFPSLTTLTVATLAGCATASWARALRRMRTLEVLEVDFAAMDAGAFDALLSTRGWGKGDRDEVTTDAQRDVILPALHTLRVSGVSGMALAALRRYRREAGRPVRMWYVHESCRDAAAEEMKAEMDMACAERRRRGGARVGGGEGEGEDEGESEWEEEEGERMEWFREEEEEEEESVLGDGEGEVLADAPFESDEDSRLGGCEESGSSDSEMGIGTGQGGSSAKEYR